MKKILLEINIDFESPIPVYEQLKKKIKQAIAKRIILQGEDLPSIREMASYLKINPNTVARSYRELVQEGIIKGRAGKGFWLERIKNLQKNQVDFIREEFLEFLEKAVKMGFSAEEIEKLVNEFLLEKK